jgi:membrane protein DedA with SNARE-associated domain
MLLFPISIFEGPIITVITGSLTAIGIMDFWAAYAILSLGDIVGDAVYYALGFYGKAQIIKRFGKLLRFDISQVESLEKHFEDHGGKTLLAGKISHGIGGVFLVAAGAAKMNFWKFIGYNILGTLPKTLFLLLIGYYFGRAISRVRSAMDYFAVFAGIAFIAAILLYLYRSKKFWPRL